jgi:hypothetical protein
MNCLLDTYCCSGFGSGSVSIAYSRTDPAHCIDRWRLHPIECSNSYICGCAYSVVSSVHQMAPESKNPAVSRTIGPRPLPSERAHSELPVGLSQVACHILPEAFATFLLLMVLTGSHKLLELVSGLDLRFFEQLPVKWAFDLGKATVVLLFVGRMVRKFR